MKEMFTGQMITADVFAANVEIYGYGENSIDQFNDAKWDMVMDLSEEFQPQEEVEKE